MKMFQSKKETLQSDIQELEKSIFCKYQEMADSIKAQKTSLDEKSENNQQTWRRLAQGNRHSNKEGKNKS